MIINENIQYNYGPGGSTQLLHQWGSISFDVVRKISFLFSMIHTVNDQKNNAEDNQNQCAMLIKNAKESAINTQDANLGVMQVKMFG